MKNRWIFGLAVTVAVFTASPARTADHFLGVGIHYWQTIDSFPSDFDFDIDDSGVSFLLSYRADPAGLLKFQGDLEYFSNGFAGSPKEAFSPQVFVLVGDFFYGGVGAGITYSSGLPSDFSDVFFLARLGLKMTLVPRVQFDVNFNFQSGAFSELDNADTDSITLGAAVRFKLN